MPDAVPVVIVGENQSRCDRLAAQLDGHGFIAAIRQTYDLSPDDFAPPAAPAAVAVQEYYEPQLLVLVADDFTQARQLMSSVNQLAADHCSMAVVLAGGDSRHRAMIIAAGADECLSGEIDAMELATRLHRLANVAALAADAAEQRLRLNRELQQARRIQHYILPLVPPKVPGVSIVAEYLPAAVLGGDFFDIIQLDEQRVGFFMADVVGHGVAAALNTMLIKSQLVVWARSGISVCETMGLLNDSLSRLVDLEYATAVYGMLDLSNWTLEYSLAGHPSPMLIRPDEPVVALPVPAPTQPRPGMRVGLPLGMFESGAYISRTIDIRPDDRIMFYTDGLIEWRAESGDRLGLDGLCHLLGEIGHRPLEDQVAWLMHSMRQRSGANAAPDDDINLLAFCRCHPE